ncbi:Aflatoxin B1 aldehyde reductase member 2 [Stylophora pistillata]|uniref:Aflatoxin B1 aldehyde reductase member 2 n=1 Tax=Stylophora pistillata TaxID=50429 RepID=A0A2B4SAR3_STYPI|nr:Aflatoxin B1 aldehyde reductase member 2 [Stylophora pistillata]
MSPKNNHDKLETSLLKVHRLINKGSGSEDKGGAVFYGYSSGQNINWVYGVWKAMCCRSGPLSKAQAKQFINICMEHDVYDFDTAYGYSGGKSEEIMGDMDCLKDSKVFIATKANPWGKGLVFDSVLEQLNESLKRLKRDSVDLFYLHAPEHTTPIEETLDAVNQLYEEGKFESFGLSNYSSWQVAEIYYLCKMNNYPVPTVYQGMYNPVTSYVNRFWKKPLFDLLDKLRGTLDRIYGEGKVTLIDASLRWMYHHSKLDGACGDAVIIGASSVKHLEENLKSTKHGPLHEDVVELFEETWGILQGDCPLYFR